MVEATLFHDQLLATKFFLPSSSHPLLPRHHLTSLLNAGRRRKLIFISAPAGFGKTTLVSAWVQSFSQPSPLTALPSSHCSPPLTLPSPQNVQPGFPQVPVRHAPWVEGALDGKSAPSHFSQASLRIPSPQAAKHVKVA